MTYSQNYYILNRNDILQKRREKEMEAKFGDFSARLVKRPKKGFMWGYGTQMHEDRTTDHGKAQLSFMPVLTLTICVCAEFFEQGKLPTIRQIINFLEVYQMKDI